MATYRVRTGYVYPVESKDINGNLITRDKLAGETLELDIVGTVPHQLELVTAPPAPPVDPA